MPPNEKLTAPSNAEAVPALVRSHSIANAVEVVKVIPIINSTASSNSSYTQKLQPKDNAAHSSIEKTSIPMQPINVPFSGRRNFTENAAAPPIAMALMLKHTLKAKGE